MLKSRQGGISVKSTLRSGNRGQRADIGSRGISLGLRIRGRDQATAEDLARTAPGVSRVVDTIAVTH